MCFLVQLRRRASLLGHPSAAAWVAAWVRGPSSTAVMLLLGAAGRQYNLGVIQGPRLAQVRGCGGAAAGRRRALHAGAGAACRAAHSWAVLLLQPAPG